MNLHTIIGWPVLFLGIMMFAVGDTVGSAIMIQIGLFMFVGAGLIIIKNKLKIHTKKLMMDFLEAPWRIAIAVAVESIAASFLKPSPVVFVLITGLAMISGSIMYLKGGKHPAEKYSLTKEELAKRVFFPKRNEQWKGVAREGRDIFQLGAVFHIVVLVVIGVLAFAQGVAYVGEFLHTYYETKFM